MLKHKSQAVFEPLLETHSFLNKSLVSGTVAVAGCETLMNAMAGMADRFETALTRPDDAAF